MIPYRCEMVRSARSGLYRVEICSLADGELLLAGPWRRSREGALAEALLELKELVSAVAHLAIWPWHRGRLEAPVTRRRVRATDRRVSEARR